MKEIEIMDGERIVELLCSMLISEKVTIEFLEKLTKMNAINVYKTTNNQDNVVNWVKGEKMTAFLIVDCYLRACNDICDCIPVPKCCLEYLDKISINEVIEHKAFLMWENNGENLNHSDDIRRKDYLKACNSIMSFCEELPQKGKECIYNNVVLTKIDRRVALGRRHQPDRRKKSPDLSAGMIKRSENNRRAFRSWANRRCHDQRGHAAQYLLPTWQQSELAIN